MDYSTWPRVIVADVEGNGTVQPDLVELATVPIEHGLIDTAAAHSWLVRPAHAITWRATKVHGLTNEDLADAPVWTEVEDEVRGLLGTAWIAGHNVTVDHNVLAAHLPGWAPAGLIDTLRLSRAIHPEAPKHTLDAALQHANIDLTSVAGQRHRAGYDAHATALLLLALAEHYQDFDHLAEAAAPKTTANRTRVAGSPTSQEATLW